MVLDKIKNLVFKKVSEFKMFLTYPEASEYTQEIRLIENKTYPAIASVTLTPMGNYCGYIRLAKRPFKEKGYDGLLRYIPVHGGITYAEQDEDGTMVYGIDFGHYCDIEDDGNGSMDFSVNPPRMRFKKRSVDEIMFEALRLYKALILAIPYEKRYLKAKNDKAKAAIIDEYHEETDKFQIHFDLGNNFGAMINMLGGKL